MTIEDLEERVQEALAAPATRVGETHPIVGRDVLEAPSRKPFLGRPDQTHPDLDSMEALYVPKYLVREWGWDAFIRSPYYKMWQTEAGEGGGQNAHDAPDPRPSERKKK